MKITANKYFFQNLLFYLEGRKYLDESRRTDKIF